MQVFVNGIAAPDDKGPLACPDECSGVTILPCEVRLYNDRVDKLQDLGISYAHHGDVYSGSDLILCV